ncbi:MAG: leucine-rich repeat domain-containing protein [Bacteroidaceae bacterium]|nr:leucine-rich repeat domain-containing protein [Bacteroidaceae bacterium]
MKAKLTKPLHILLIIFTALCSCRGISTENILECWQSNNAQKYTNEDKCWIYPIYEENSICFYLEDTIAVVAPYIETMHGFESILANYYCDTIVIPTSVYHDGREYPVRKIGSGAFSSSNNIQHIVIPEGIKEIENSSFVYCSLKSIDIPSSTTIIGIDAFNECRQLKEIKISENNPVYASISGQSVIIDKKSNKLHRMVNAGNIPSSIKHIGRGAFSSLKINTLYIPENIETIEPGAFLNCSIDSIKIHPDNRFFDTTPGINCIIDSKTGVLLAGAKSVRIIPDNVIEISNDAFRGVELGDSIVLNEKLRIIGDGAFYGHNFKAIHIPSNVHKIGDKAFALDEFANSNRLTSITLDDRNRHFNSPQGSNVLIRKKDKALILGCSNSTIPKGIKSIGYGAFQDCLISSVNIPEGVLHIGDSAFIDCRKLTELHLPKSIKTLGNSAFQRCTALTDVVLPEDLVELGKYCFCLTDIDSITIPGGIKVIGDNAFSYTQLTDIVIPEGVVIIGESAFNSTPLKSVTLPESLKIIADAAFSSCGELYSIELPQSLRYIGNRAFTYTALDKVNFGKSLEVIGENAFGACDNIRYVYIPASVKVIGDCAFYGCRLDSLFVHDDNERYYSGAYNVIVDKSDNRVIAGSSAASIPDGVEIIAKQSFFAVNINNIQLPEGVTTIEESAFYASNAMTQIQFPHTLTKIENSAFCNCSSLKTIHIPGGIDVIPEAAFSLCTSLENVTIAEGVKVIEDYAFHSCTNLKTIVIPSTVTQIGKNVFKDCWQLKNIINKSNIDIAPIETPKPTRDYSRSIAAIVL